MQKIRYHRALGENIRKHRLENHFTQVQVVVKMQTLDCFISRETYAKIESGIANVKVEELVAFTKIFNCDFNSLFSGLDKKQTGSEANPQR